MAETTETTETAETPWYSGITDFFTDDEGNIDWGNSLLALLGAGGASYAINNWDSVTDFVYPSYSGVGQVGYQGEIPRYEMVRGRVSSSDNIYNPDREPGAVGQRYFTRPQFVEKDNSEATLAAQSAAATRAAELGQENRTEVNTYNAVRAARDAARGYAAGGIAGIQPTQKMPMLQQANKSMGMPQNPAQGIASMNPIKPPMPQMQGGQAPRSQAPQAQAPRPQPQPQQGTPVAQPQQGAPAAPSMGPEDILRQIAMTGKVTPPKPQAPPQAMAQGGIASAAPARYLNGGTDGMADNVPAVIQGQGQQQAAALSDGEFVIPADVVSHLGNGNSTAGANQLYSMMDRVRQARTGQRQQAQQINPNRYIPGV